KGFDTIPKKRSLYKGRVVAEMNLDARRVRRPRLARIDDTPPTTAEGSRRPKRSRNVEELLAAGIDVYTTVNVQHIESLNDVIAQITHVQVRETVPDKVLDEGDKDSVVQ